MSTPPAAPATPEATYLLEQTVDDLARELARDPVELRRANLFPPLPFYRLPTGLGLNSGDYAACMDAALALAAGYPELRERQAQLLKQGRYFGIGLAIFAENSGVGTFDGHGCGRVPKRASGRTVFCGAQSTGQGHTTDLRSDCG